MVLLIAEQNPCRTMCVLLLLIDLSPFEQYLLPYTAKGIVIPNLSALSFCE